MDKLSPECIFIMVYLRFFYVMGYPYGSVIKNYPPSAGDTGSISGSGRSPGEGNGNPLQYSCLKNLMDRVVWWAIVHGVTRVGHDLATKPPPPPYINTYVPVHYC